MKKSSSAETKTLGKKKRISSMTTTFKQSQNESQNCLFCKKLRQRQASTFSYMINKALYSKYSSSQNYYYSKDICDILDNESTPQVVFFRDLQVIIEDEDYLKRLYKSIEGDRKFDSLIEYYKYHIDIPRLYMRNICRTIYYFHDKKRRLQYGKIKQNLGLSDEVPRSSKPKEQNNIQLKNVLAPLKMEFSVSQKPQTSQQLLRQNDTKQKQDPSISILSIVQNMPKFDQNKNMLYLDSFDENQLDRQLREMSKLFKEKKPASKPKYKPKLQLQVNYIPQTVIQSIIEQQKKQIQNLKRNQQQCIKPRIKSIHIEYEQKRIIKSPQQSQRSIQSKHSNERIQNQLLADLKSNNIYLPVRTLQIKEKSRRTNSNHQPQINSSNLVLNQEELFRNRLKINMTQLLSNQTKPSTGAATTRQPLKSNDIKSMIQKAYQTSHMNSVQNKQQRTRSTHQLILQNEISPNDVYVSGSRQKYPSLHSSKQKSVAPIRFPGSGSSTARSMINHKGSSNHLAVKSGMQDLIRGKSKY